MKTFPNIFKHLQISAAGFQKKKAGSVSFVLRVSRSNSPTELELHFSCLEVELKILWMYFFMAHMHRNQTFERCFVTLGGSLRDCFWSSKSTEYANFGNTCKLKLLKSSHV